MSDILPADPVAALPPAFLVVGAAVGFVVVLLAAGTALSPRSRRQLRFLREQTGIGWGIGAALVVAFTATFGSVFALGGTTTGRHDYPLVFSLLVHVVGLFLLGDAAGTLPRYLAVRRTPRRDAAAVEPGERVAVDGEATATDGTIETPFTGEPALCYEARVMERRGDSGYAVNAESLGVGGNWHAEYVTGAGVAFGVEDASGSVRVVPDGAHLRMDETADVTVTLEDDLPDRIRAFVTDHMVEVGFGGHDRRYVEAALRPGDWVTVVGPAVPADEGGSAAVDGREGECVVASRGVDGFQSKLRRRVTGATVGGLAGTALGYVAMLTASGVA